MYRVTMFQTYVHRIFQEPLATHRVRALPGKPHISLGRARRVHAQEPPHDEASAVVGAGAARHRGPRDDLRQVARALPQALGPLAGLCRVGPHCEEPYRLAQAHDPAPVRRRKAVCTAPQGRRQEDTRTEAQGRGTSRSLDYRATGQLRRRLLEHLNTNPWTASKPKASGANQVPPRRGA